MNIQTLRGVIDATDDLIVMALFTRMSASMQIARLKAGSGLPPRDKKREAFILRRARKLARAPLTGNAAAQVMTRILEVTRAATKAALKKGKYEKRA